MEKYIKILFSYDNDGDYKKNLDILTDVFGSDILMDLKNDSQERVVSLYISNFNETHLFNVLGKYTDEEIRFKLVENTLFLGIGSVFTKIGM